MGVVAVPDPRLERLAALYDGAPVVPAIGDLRGHRRPRARGVAGRGARATSSWPPSARPMPSARSCAPSTTTTSSTSTPGSTRRADIETVNTELILADLQTVEHRLPRLAKEARATAVAQADRSTPSPRRSASSARAAPSRARRRPARSTPSLLRDLHLLTAKPFIYVFNVDEGALGDAGPGGGPGRTGAPGAGRRAVRPDRGGGGGTGRGRRQGAAAQLRAGGVGAGAAGPRGLRHARAADLPDRRAQGGAGVDHPCRRHRAQGRRGHPHRLRAGVHQGRGHQLRRPDGVPARSPPRATPARRAWRARTTSCATATWWSSASTPENLRRIEHAEVLGPGHLRLSTNEGNIR